MSSRPQDAKYSSSIGTANLCDVAVKAKPMPVDMLSKDGFFVTKKFYDYAAPLVGPMPEMASLKFAKAKAAKKNVCSCGCECK